MLTQFGITIHNTITYYITLAYLPTWLTSVVKLPQSQSLAISTIGLLLLVCLIRRSARSQTGSAASRYSISSCVGFIVLCYPLYRFASSGSFVAALWPSFCWWQ